MMKFGLFMFITFYAATWAISTQVAVTPSVALKLTVSKRAHFKPLMPRLLEQQEKPPSYIHAVPWNRTEADEATPTPHGTLIQSSEKTGSPGMKPADATSSPKYSAVRNRNGNPVEDSFLACLVGFVIFIIVLVTSLVLLLF
jgi:hypothetical protein